MEFVLLGFLFTWTKVITHIQFFILLYILEKRAESREQRAESREKRAEKRDKTFKIVKH